MFNLNLIKTLRGGGSPKSFLKNSKTPLKSSKNLSLFLALFTATSALAEGIDKVNSSLQLLADALIAAGSITITIALVYVGIKVMFQGRALGEFMNIFIGGLVIGAASVISGYILSGS